jgi:hypothetical protein
MLRIGVHELNILVIQIVEGLIFLGDPFFSPFVSVGSQSNRQACCREYYTQSRCDILPGLQIWLDVIQCHYNLLCFIFIFRLNVFPKDNLNSCLS